MTNEELKAALEGAIWDADDDYTRADAEPFPERILKGIYKTLEAHGYAIVPAEPTREMWAVGGMQYDIVTEAVWAGMIEAGKVTL